MQEYRSVDTDLGADIETKRQASTTFSIQIILCTNTVSEKSDVHCNQGSV